MTKKNTNLSKTVGLLLVLTLLALIAISGTYAKYTTSVSGNATAVIAKWDIKFTNDEKTIANNFDIDLAKTMTSSDNANTFIQPGSQGSFKVKVTNDSDVPAMVVATVSDNSNTIFQNGQFTLTVDGSTSADGVEIAPNGSKEVTITWKWNYESADNKDTVDAADTVIGTGSDKTAQTICGITLSATQKNITK